MLKCSLFLDSEATTNLCNDYRNTPIENQGYYLKTEFTYESLLNCLHDILDYAVSNHTKNVIYEEGVALWNIAFSEAFSSFVDSISALITASDHRSNAEFMIYSSYILSFVTYMVPEKIFTKIGKKRNLLLQLLIESIQQLNGRLRKLLNKWIKCSLKHSFDVTFTLNLLCQLHIKLHGKRNEPDDNKALLLWQNAFKCDQGDYYNPTTMLQLILGHSKFLDVLNVADINLHIPLLQLILGNFIII